MIIEIQPLAFEFIPIKLPSIRDLQKLTIPIGSGDRPKAARKWTNDLTI